MDLKLAGKRAIVTGGSRGIGKAIALALGREGVEVAIAGRDSVALEAATFELANALGRRVTPIRADTGDDASVDNLVRAAIAELGGIDILVNNAATPGGAAPAARLAEVDGAALLADVNVKVAGYLRTARAVAPHLAEAGWGRIINIGGLAARTTGHYVASIRNGAVSSLTKNLADELGPRGITANVIHPGGTRTEKTTPEAEARIAQGNTIGRIVDASEIAWLVAVLASPLSGAINGQTIAAGGGVPKTIDY
ncbi:short-chain dehydrogenase [Caulobacter radicis]|uniref:SDR family NAD(P)-dependent oxidoreductase n=1 Tax=Caulobacter radicis TaxID=2172650 RepID=UPI000D583863|nr:SDR family oxidoreductase [Caulobacter radicis]PVM88407.1 short-chain dehydrogenase [Caulobacter radicis]